MLTFLEWVSQYNEGFMDRHQAGDQVLFNVHNAENLEMPLDLNKLTHHIGHVQRSAGGNVFVTKPEKTRHRGMKRFMSKDGTGLLKLASAHLQEIPSEMLMGGGDATHKTYIYAPGPYHKGFLKRADRKMMSASDPADATGPDMAFAQQNPVRALPAPTPPQTLRPMNY